MVHYDTLIQNVTDIIIKCNSFFITKRDKCLSQNASGFLLQNVILLLENEIFNAIFYNEMQQLLQDASSQTTLHQYL